MPNAGLQPRERIISSLPRCTVPNGAPRMNSDNFAEMAGGFFLVLTAFIQLISYLKQALAEPIDTSGRTDDG